MKRINYIVIVVCMFVLYGCGSSHDGEIKTTESAKYYKGKNYEEVMSSLGGLGFTNITTQEIPDLVTGWLTKEGEVESVSIAGDKEFDSDQWYKADSQVVITYHTFPPEKTKEEKGTEEVATSEAIDIGAGADGAVEDTAPDTYVVESEAEQEEVLTVENCPDFATILTIHGESDPLYADFVEKYQNRTIEFDGCITYLANHDDYDTRYDILLSAGNYVDDDTANPGPNFKFKDVNSNNLGIQDLSLPDYISMRSNVHIIATVYDYNFDTGIFELKPISVTER